MYVRFYLLNIIRHKGAIISGIASFSGEGLAEKKEDFAARMVSVTSSNDPFTSGLQE
jgi:hypothetical protein